MLYLKRINYKDIGKEYKTVRKSMTDDGGFKNQNHIGSFIDDAFFKNLFLLLIIAYGIIKKSLVYLR